MTHIEALSVETLDEPRELADASIIDPGIDRYEDGGRRDLARSTTGDHSAPSSCLELANNHKYP